MLASYFEEKTPLYLDDKEKSPNIREVVEQPYHQIMGEKWGSLADITLEISRSSWRKQKQIWSADTGRLSIAFNSAPQQTKEYLKYWEAFSA